jgi:hypothetical protein
MAPSYGERERWHLIARIVISLSLLIVSCTILLKGTYSDATTKWAIGIVGVIVGYWLR